MSASREEIIQEIRKLAAMNNGQPPGRRLFRRRTNIHPAEWQGVYWAIWSDALKEAGFQPNHHRGELLSKSFLERCYDQPELFSHQRQRLRRRKFFLLPDGQLQHLEERPSGARDDRG